MLRFNYLCLTLISFLLSAPSCIDAIVTNEVQTRRTTISNTIHSLATLTFAAEAKATTTSTSTSTGIEERAMVPGTGMRAPLKNVIISDDDDVANVRTDISSSLVTQLAKSRIGAKELSPLNPSLVPFAADNELYYGTLILFSF